MSYEARVNEDDTWRVCDFRKRITAAYRVHGKARAEIFAWSLNAVTEGLYLVATNDLTLEDSAYRTDAKYDGPTDGVAP